jgi:hypothetical protein
MGLDIVLAHIRGRSPRRDLFAREISEGAAGLFDSTTWLAFLDGIRRLCVAPADIRQRVLLSMDRQETLIEERIPKNIARPRMGRWNQMVFERRLSAFREAHDVHDRVSALLPARSGIDHSLAQPDVETASHHSHGHSADCSWFDVGTLG